MNGEKKLKILFDARHIKDIYSGLARYTYSILDTLISINFYSELEIILDKNQNYSNNPLFLNIQKKISTKIYLAMIDAPLFKFKHHINTSKYVNQSNADVYFYPHFDMPFFINKKSIFVIHDLFPLVMDDYILKYRYIKTLYFKLIIKANLFKNNTECIAISESTKNDIMNFFGKYYESKIKVVYEDSFENATIACVSNKNVAEVVTDSYLFYIGDRRPHKNIQNMINIFDILKHSFNYKGSFIIAGSDKNFNFNINDYIKNKPYIRAIGKVSDEELVTLYKNMDSLFFLSKYEGFGLPIIEASKYNKKIIILNTSSCKEIAPPCTLKLEASSNDHEKAKLISRYINKKLTIDNSEYLKKFSWENSVLSIFNGVI